MRDFNKLIAHKLPSAKARRGRSPSAPAHSPAARAPATLHAMSRAFSRRISHLESHHRFLVAAVFALAVLAVVHGRWRLPLELIAGWDAFALAFLTLAWTRMIKAEARVLARLARLAHTSRTLIFVFVLCGAVASLAAVGYVLSGAKNAAGAARSAHVVAAIGTVMISWFLVHTIFALYYAYLFYRHTSLAHETAPGGGLDFPGTEHPDYADFAYFSFIIGMTSQVSDVQISERGIRRWALVHGLVSFAFNAAILALSINIISGLF